MNDPTGIRKRWKELHRARRVAHCEASKALSEMLAHGTGMTFTDEHGTKHVPFVDGRMLASAMERAVNPPLIIDPAILPYEVKNWPRQFKKS